MVREGGTLVTIAKDVKIQVEFNPKAAVGYRLTGYENRVLRSEDFNDDQRDAGEIGAGHAVTALYEIVPVGEEMTGPIVGPLKYQTSAQPTSAASADELMTVKLRYKAPDADQSRLVAAAVRHQRPAMRANLGFASAVAEVGMLLRIEARAGGELCCGRRAGAAVPARDPDGNGAEFIKLAELAMSPGRMRTNSRPQH